MASRLGGGVVRPAVVAGLLGIAFGAVVMLFLLPSDLFGRVPPLSGTISAAPETVAVVDGETLRLREDGWCMVRLQERGGAAARASDAHAGDGSVSDCGAEAATALAALVRELDVACRLHGRDSAGLAQGVQTWPRRGPEPHAGGRRLGARAGRLRHGRCGNGGPGGAARVVAGRPLTGLLGEVQGLGPWRGSGQRPALTLLQARRLRFRRRDPRFPTDTAKWRKERRMSGTAAKANGSITVTLNGTNSLDD